MDKRLQSYEPVIGLEIHVQLKTKSKMFCPCAVGTDGQAPNTTVCPICLGHPGTLPQPNTEAITYAVTAAAAVHCELNASTHFDRKNYFYPDLPKGYQITQYDLPFGHDGYLIVGSGDDRQRIRIERVHLEEDTGKLLHDSEKGATYVDYNRAGTPLMELVTYPDIQSPSAARAFLQELQLTLRYLGVSDADMEKGHLRCDANISLRPVAEYRAAALEKQGEDFPERPYYPKTEIKNLNSFKSVERALEHEIKRQTELWEKGNAPRKTTTHGWDEKQGVTILQRVKEELHDYRYFPEPDIPPLKLSEEFLATVRRQTVELPSEKRERLMREYQLPAYDAGVLVADKHLGSYFEEAMSELRSWLVSFGEVDRDEDERWDQHRKKLAKTTANWMISRLMSLMNQAGHAASAIPVTPENFAELMTMLFRHTVNNQTAQQILTEMYRTGGDPSDIWEALRAGHAEQDGLDTVIAGVLNEHATVVEQFRAGKAVALQYLIGQVMRQTKGAYDASEVREALLQKIQ